jgi:hypothetical protein
MFQTPGRYGALAALGMLHGGGSGGTCRPPDTTQAA